MKKYTLSYHCLLRASIEDVFTFHTDTHNLALITPSSTQVSIISMDTPLHEKSRVVLDIKRFGITTRWEMEIAVFSAPNALVDAMIKGPFAFFRHERHFIKLDETLTRMEETISFSPPFAWFGNILFLFLKKDMDAMFAYRHKATQAYFLSKEKL